MAFIICHHPSPCFYVFLLLFRIYILLLTSRIYFIKFVPVNTALDCCFLLWPWLFWLYQRCFHRLISLSRFNYLLLVIYILWFYIYLFFLFLFCLYCWYWLILSLFKVWFNLTLSFLFRLICFLFLHCFRFINRSCLFSQWVGDHPTHSRLP